VTDRDADHTGLARGTAEVPRANRRDNRRLNKHCCHALVTQAD